MQFYPRTAGGEATYANKQPRKKTLKKFRLKTHHHYDTGAVLLSLSCRANYHLGLQNKSPNLHMKAKPWRILVAEVK